jgi:hypothetical protein
VRWLIPILPLSVRFPAFTNLAGVLLITMFSAAISLVTYCLIEHPFLQLRKSVLGSHSHHTAPAN